jgi:hypothetical protein
MAFIVQNDSGNVAGANAYITVDELKAYHDDRGNDYSDYATGDLEKAIVRATDFIDERWDYQGEKLNSTQSTSWPRRDVYVDDLLVTGIPDDVKEACAEYAFISAGGTELDPAPAVDSRNQVIQRKREKVGPLEEETEYVSGGVTASPSFPVGDRKLRDFIIKSGTIRRA